jgi:hypothetical protein
MLGSLLFATALVASWFVFTATLLPAVPRIIGLLRYGVDPAAPAMMTTVRPRPAMRRVHSRPEGLVAAQRAVA